MSEDSRALISAITQASGSTRKFLINEFFDSRKKLFINIANHFCRNYGVAPSTHAEDFEQMVAQEAFVFLNELIDNPDDLDEIQNWEGMLKVRSRNPIKAWMDKHSGAASGMSTVNRRVRMLNALRDEMTRDGAEVSRQEIVDEHNRRMYERRANPENECVIATIDDLSVSRHAADIADHDREMAVDDDFVLHPTESPRFIKLLVERAEKHNPRLGECASLWLQGFYDEKGEQATVQDISEAMGVSRSTVRNYKRQIKEFAIVVLRDELGITMDDVA